MRWLCLALVVASCARSHKSDSLELYTNGATADERLPLIVALHGYGGTPEDVPRVLHDLSVRARVLAPRGLFPVGDGWGWFPPLRETAPDEVAPGITHAADIVAKQIADEVRTRPTCGVPIVIGFSQGGFLSYALAVRTPAVVSAAFPLSGFLPAALRPKTKPADAPHITAFHGEADKIVSVSLDRETQEALAHAGYETQLQLYPGVGHAVPGPVATDVRLAIVRAIRDAGCAH